MQKIYSFKGEVIIIKDENIACSRKQILRSQFSLEIMDLAIGYGNEITLVVSGIDEHSAFNELENFLLNNVSSSEV